jgi:cytosine/adenosine deaminase-related metal-dependent hydrolase/SAM-dependent methyltransferase
MGAAVHRAAEAETGEPVDGSGKAMGSYSATTCVSPAEGYRVWASSYHREPNPMLALEKRFLEALLPPVQGIDVVDFGCGTGRWLETLKDKQPGSIVGVDCSSEMLEVARNKLGEGAQLVCGDCAEVTLEPLSADLIFCNFLLSYVEDAAAFLTKVSSTLRSKGCVFITDLHPETTAQLNWRRGVQFEEGFQEIRTFPRSIESVIELCQTANLRVSACLEPRFDEPERDIFREAGKLDYFEKIKGFPAIYILQLHKQPPHARVIHYEKNKRESVNYIGGARLALGPQSSVLGNIGLKGACVESLHTDSRKARRERRSEETLDLGGFLLLPGLVNAHDHLEFALFPRLGKGGYNNFLEWADDIHRPGASPVSEHRQVPREVRLWWGGIRNLLCGVTTVCHHNPYEAGVFENDFVIRVLREYGWAHSVPLDADVAAKKRNTPKGQPFLVHLGEGIDEQSAEEVFELHRARALDEETILIHGLALGEKGVALLHAARAGLIWCPSSNVFLFGRTLSRDEIRSISRVAIGSDSPLTAQGDLLDEVRFAREISELRADELYQWVTMRAAELLRLKNGEGSLRIGARADLIAVRDTGQAPADRLADLCYQDIELVLLGGRVHLASEEMVKRLPSRTVLGLRRICVEGTVRWIRAPLDWLFEQTKSHLGGNINLGGKQVNVGA